MTVSRSPTLVKLFFFLPFFPPPLRFTTLHEYFFVSNPPQTRVFQTQRIGAQCRARSRPLGPRLSYSAKFSAVAQLEENKVFGEAPLLDRLYLLAPVYGGLIIGCKSSLAGEGRKGERERERERE